MAIFTGSVKNIGFNQGFSSLNHSGGQGIPVSMTDSNNLIRWIGTNTTVNIKHPVYLMSGTPAIDSFHFQSFQVRINTPTEFTCVGYPWIAEGPGGYCIIGYYGNPVRYVVLFSENIGGPYNIVFEHNSIGFNSITSGHDYYILNAGSSDGLVYYSQDGQDWDLLNTRIDNVIHNYGDWNGIGWKIGYI